MRCSSRKTPNYKEIDAYPSDYFVHKRFLRGNESSFSEYAIILPSDRALFQETSVKLSARLVLFSMLLCLSLSTLAFADNAHERTQMGHNITVAEGEHVNEATCFGCSVRVRGQVDGDVTAFGGSIIVENGASVGGDATTFGGDVRLDKDVKLSGDVTVFGGRLRRDPGATVGGDVTNFGGPAWILLIFVLPLMFLGAFIALVVWLIRKLLRVALPATA